MAPTCLFDLRNRSSNTRHTGWEGAGSQLYTDLFGRNGNTLSEIGEEGVCFLYNAQLKECSCLFLVYKGSYQMRLFN